MSPPAVEKSVIPETPENKDSTELKHIYFFSDFTVDIDARRLLRDDEPVVLPSRVFDVLVHLIEHRSRPVQKDEIITAIWDDVIVTDDSLIHAISLLRRTLGDDPQRPRFIATIPRRGYRFVGEVTAAACQPESPAINPMLSVEGPGHVSVPVKEISRAEFFFRRIPYAVTAALVLFAALVWLWPEPPLPRMETGGFDASVSLVQTAPAGTSIVSGGVLSPDSRYLAFPARDDASGLTDLWVRNLQSNEVRRIPDTVGASKPFWSPDAARLGFFSSGEMIITDLNGQFRQAIARVDSAAGASWGSGNTIMYAEWTSGLYSVSATGEGEVTAVTTRARDTRDIAFAWPQLLPDGQRFLYQVVSLEPERAGIYVGNMETGQSFRLLESSSAATFAPPNYLLHIDQDLLIAEEMDPVRMTLTGHAVVLAREVAAPLLATDNAVSASADLLTWQEGKNEQNLTWFDRNGQPRETLALPIRFYNPRLSPDGTRLLASSSVTTEPGLWLSSLESGEVTRIETDAVAPVWSSDGRSIAFTSRDGADIMMRSEASQQTRVLLSGDPAVKILSDWSGDGRTLVYIRQSGDTGLDLWSLDIGTGETKPLLATQANETQARLSPDGRWLAWASDQEGRLEVFVATFPDLADRQRVSAQGGGQPQWRADSRELFYLSPASTLMSTGVDDGGIVKESAVELFITPIAGSPGQARENYAASFDGQRFLIDAEYSGGNDKEISLMVNWASRIRDSHAAPLTSSP